MISEKPQDRTRLTKAALGLLPCDLSIQNIKLVNVITEEIYPASVDILDGIVVRVRQEGEESPLPAKEVLDGEGRYLAPGFVDTHMHVESTMMLPENLSRAILPWGTTTVCIDPHEIANVQGVKGVRFMLQSIGKSALRQYVLAPSCVPAVPALEGAGASFGAEEVAALLDTEGVLGIAEVMDFVGVANDEKRMHDIIGEGVKRGMFLQGHAPGITGALLAAYRLGGPNTDHESRTAQELRDKLRNGIHINLRASSIIDSLTELMKGLQGVSTDFVSICTDDVHAKDLLTTGHINHVVGKCISLGMEPVKAYKLGTLNSAREIGRDDLGAIAPGYRADVQLLSALDGSMPHMVLMGGRLVAQDGAYLATDKDDVPAYAFENTMKIRSVSTAQDLLLRVPDAHKDDAFTEVQVLIPEHDGFIRNGVWTKLPVKNGCISLEGHDDLAFISVINRHGAADRSIAVIGGFGLKKGAIASTVSHDCHNLTIVYRSPEDALICLNTLAQCGGGMCAVADGELLSLLELPVAGLMSPLPCKALAPHIESTQNAMLSLCNDKMSLLRLAICALPVLPGLEVTDRGVVNGLTQQFVEIFR